MIDICLTAAHAADGNMIMSTAFAELHISPLAIFGYAVFALVLGVPLSLSAVAVCFLIVRAIV